MAIPDFQSILLPFMRILEDEEEHSLSEVIDTLAGQFELSSEERKELLPSGAQARFDNRVGWARTYLKKAKLLESTGRGKFVITQRGLEVVKSNPTGIDITFLKRYPEFVEFQTMSRRKEQGQPDTVLDELSQTPEEVLETAYQNLRDKLAQELLAQVKSCSPRFFERLVIDLLLAMGYGGSRQDAGQAVGQTADDGIDGVIKEDRLGLDTVYIQAKRWNNVVGRPIVQAFAGSLEGYRARKGILITTSDFSKEALEYVNRIEKRIVLIGGQELAGLMIDYGVGVSEVASYSVKRVDLDYFAGAE